MIEGQVHTFTYKDKNVVLDVNSNSLFTVDKLAKAIIDFYKDYTLAEIIIKLKNEYNSNSVEEAYREITSLAEQGILYSEGVEPESYTESEEFAIKSMCLHVSHDCDLRCKYCFAGTGPYGQQRTLMTAETGKKAIDFLVAQAKNNNFFEIDFFGGEPLLNFDVVKELVAYCRELEKKSVNKFDFSLTTNGTHLDEEVEEFALKEKINLILSIDGRKDVNDFMRPKAGGEGSYDTIINNYLRLNKGRTNVADNRYGRGIYTYYRGTFTSQNLDFSKDLIHLSDLGFKRISIEPVILGEKNKFAIKRENLPAIFEQYDILADTYLERKNTDKEFYFHHFEVDLEDGPCFAKRITGCGAGYHYMAVTPEGDIYPCHQFVGNKDTIIGHIDKGFTNKKFMNKLRNTNVYTKEACRTCWARHLCGGGCHVNAYAFNDDLTKPHGIACEMMKKRYEAALYLKALELEAN